MKRLIVLVVMLVVGMMLVGSVEAFCVYNKTDKSIQVNVIMANSMKEKTTAFNVNPNNKNCEYESVNFNPTYVKVIVLDAKSPNSLCSITMGSAKDVEVTGKDNQYSCSEKK